MFNDDGMGQAMTISYAEKAGSDAQEKVKWLEANLLETVNRVMELQSQVSYLMRMDAERKAKGE